MADVEMELDISHIMGLDGHVDDDLIDYDDDDVEISGTTWKTHQVLSDADQNLLENDENMQTNGEQVHSHPSTQTMADKPMSQTEEEIVVDHQETPDNDTFMSASHTVEAPTEEQGTTMSLSRAEVHDVTEILQPQPEVDDPNGNISLSEEQPADDKYEIDEIDYDDDGDDVANAPSANQASSHQTNDGELSQTQTNELPVVKETESPVHELDDRLAQAELAEHKDAPVESAKDEHDEEITWEDNGDELEISAIDQNPNTIVHTLSDQVNSKDQHHGMEDSGQPGGSVLNPNQESVEWDEERHDSDASRGVADESGENFQHENEQLEHPQSEAHDDLGEAQHDRYTDVENNSLNQHDDLHYPAVTVAYKGEEYPLISASADAFFSDLSIQDLTIKDMLAQFRDVLGEEITPTEELVFKIDELGLEFFETSPFDLVNGITMRGLLEVFDVLVRNQDPDTSRVLYSYLYAKPNATKRLEFLTESAANGIGLDEVSYLFDASMPYGSSTNHTIDDGEGHGEQEFTGEENEDQPDYNTDVDHEVDHEDENGEAYGDYNEGKHSLEAQVKEHDQLAAGQVGGSGEFNAPEDVDAAEEDPTLLDVAANMPDGSTTARNGLAFEDDKIDFNLGSTTTIGHDELEDPFIDEAETRSLNTVKSIDAATAPEDELDFGLTQANDSTIAPKDEDLLSEIDWCDPSAPEDQAQEETPPTPSSATKRSRPEDEVELDTQQDAKRLRF